MEFECTVDISVAEMKKVMKVLRNGRAAGMIEVTAKMLQNCGDNTLKVLRTISQ